MADTIMLFAALGWDRFEGRTVERQRVGVRRISRRELGPASEKRRLAMRSTSTLHSGRERYGIRTHVRSSNWHIAPDA